MIERKVHSQKRLACDLKLGEWADAGAHMGQSMKIVLESVRLLDGSVWVGTFAVEAKQECCSKCQLHVYLEALARSHQRRHWAVSDWGGVYKQRCQHRRQRPG